MVCFNNSIKVMYFLLTIVNVNGLSSVGVFIENHQRLRTNITLPLRIMKPLPSVTR